MAEEGTKKILLGFLFLIIAILIIIGVIFAVKNLPDKIRAIGATATNTPIQLPSPLAKAFNIVLGIVSPITVEQLVLFLAIFVIIFFGLGELVSMFSTFSEATSFIIAFGLAIIAGVTKVISVIASYAALTAGIGAIGILLIIVGAIAAAITLNLGVGGAVRRWRMRRQVEIEAMKSEKGTGRVTSALKGLKEVEKELAGKETV